jgi:hypothetical protein
MLIPITGKVGARPDLDTEEKIQSLVGQPFFGEDPSVQIGKVTRAWRDPAPDGEVVVEVQVDELILKQDFARARLRGEPLKAVVPPPAPVAEPKQEPR